MYFKACFCEFYSYMFCTFSAKFFFFILFLLSVYFDRLFLNISYYNSNEHVRLFECERSDLFQPKSLHHEGSNTGSRGFKAETDATIGHRVGWKIAESWRGIENFRKYLHKHYLHRLYEICRILIKHFLNGSFTSYFDTIILVSAIN